MRMQSVIEKLDDISRRLSRLEDLSRGGRAVYVGRNRLLVRCDVGAVRTMYFVDADDQLIVPHLIAHGSYETGVTEFVTANVREFDHCVDVGAHFGYYCCIMAKLAWQGRTLGVEADPETCVLLRDNIYANWCEQAASALNVAIADKTGSLQLYRRNRRSGNTSIIDVGPDAAQVLGETPPTRIDVPSAPIDSLLPRMGGRIDFMKIDIEGSEPLAFRGMTETIRTNPEILIIAEWSPGQMQAAGFDVSRVADDIAGLGLRPHAISEGRAGAMSWDDLRATSYLSGVVFATRTISEPRRRET